MSATRDAPSRTVTVTFDKPLQPNPALHLASWYWTNSPVQRYVATTAATLGTHQVQFVHSSIVSFAPSVIGTAYRALMTDLFGLNGLAVQAFEGLPTS